MKSQFCISQSIGTPAFKGLSHIKPYNLKFSFYETDEFKIYNARNKIKHQAVFELHSTPQNDINCTTGSIDKRADKTNLNSCNKKMKKGL